MTSPLALLSNKIHRIDKVTLKVSPFVLNDKDEFFVGLAAFEFRRLRQCDRRRQIIVSEVP
jgi:hypothetical protein